MGKFLFTLLTVFFFTLGLWASEDYVCAKISRDKDEVSWSCLEDASDEMRFKSQFMSQKLLNHVAAIEKQIGRQYVFIIARAGSSLKGFNNLKTYDDNGQPITLDEIYNYGVSHMPNQSIDEEKYQRWYELDSVKLLNYSSAINQSREKIKKKYLNNDHPKLEFSHGAILFRTQEGVWNIYHELMPCNEKGKAYLFQDSTFSASSSFFIDKPHKYTALVLPIKMGLQQRIMHAIANDHVDLVRGPVYGAMSNPWSAKTGNSNSFILELIELGLTHPNTYNSMVREYSEKRSNYLDYIQTKKDELGVEKLSLEQKKLIETKDPHYKKVCRPEFNIRKQLVENYTRKGYQPAKVVFESGVVTKLKDIFEQVKVTAIPYLGKHIRPDKEVYGKHMKLGIGESISMKSIWDYLAKRNLLNKEVDSSMYIVPELTYADAVNMSDMVANNIFSLVKGEDKQLEELEKFEAVLETMKMKGK